MMRLIQYLVLPREVTPFEDRYLRRMNKVALAFFWLHPPVFVGVALLAGTSVTLALILSLGAMVGPMLGYFAFTARPRVVSMIYGFTAMLMGGALVYIGQGPMQIEMHFYFFVLIALLAVFGNPMVILIATVTVAVHHFVVWLTVPHGVFNYEASFWTVAVHAIFVVIESVAACFVARSFFDNVIGLEKIVTNRTKALDGRNRDMARILDNVEQGFVSVGLDGAMGSEWSRALARWFGEPTPGARLWDFLMDEPDLRAWMQLGFDSLTDGFMPFEVVIDQFPRRITKAGREYRVDYQPVGEPLASLLVVVSDITEEIARHRAEGVQRELIAVVEKAFRDRGGFTSFLGEAEELVRRCVVAQDEPLGELKRRLHTLKGNAALFGVTSVSTVCHELEDAIQDSGIAPDPASRARLGDTWREFYERISRVLGLSSRRAVVVDWDDYQAVSEAITLDPEPPWATRIKDWGKTATRPRLEQFAEYTRMLAQRLGKQDVEIVIADNDVRVPSERFSSVWSALVHAIRNAVDHGIESPEIRTAAGKPAHGRVTFDTHVVGNAMYIEISDDGGGIDWPRVAEKARQRGMAATTQQDLDEAVFASGVSTAEQVTDTSGRGVGLDALRATCRELGGRVELHSVRGVGTRLSCVLPLGPSVAPRRVLRKTANGSNGMAIR
jgi:two-component system chemotaxis sensor kinase CheA